MSELNRTLRRTPIEDIDNYLRSGGGAALQTAMEMSPEDIIDVVAASGLRGRGGGGFPTGTKWRAVADLSAGGASSVIVNGAEGEPGSFKDRTIFRNNPYQVIEGALIAGRAIGATDIVVAVKSEFETEVHRLEQAIQEFEARGLADVTLRMVTGPSSYLFGEESALLEVVEGRAPFPRVNPPYRRGIGESTGDANASNDARLASQMNSDGSAALVNNVETLSNVAHIFRHGVELFRSVGTPECPGTTVCTITGATQRHAVGEFAMGTPLWEVIDTLGHGARPGRTLIGAISGTANAVLTADQFDTPLCFDAMNNIGSGLGASGFIVFDDHSDLAAVAHGVARFLAIESCGQCEPCKLDGAAIAERLDSIRQSDSTSDPDRLDRQLEDLFDTVADGARCGLAAQHETAVASLHRLAGTATTAHLEGDLGPTGMALVAPIVDIVDGKAMIDSSHLDKALDWTTGGTPSGAAPADRVNSAGSP